MSDLEFDDVVNPPTKADIQIQELQECLEKERDARKEERFFFSLLTVILLDVVFFSVMDTFAAPLALLVLELLVLIPLARRMGVNEIAQIISRVLDRIAGKAAGSEDG